MNRYTGEASNPIGDVPRLTLTMLRGGYYRIGSHFVRAICLSKRTAHECFSVQLLRQPLTASRTDGYSGTVQVVGPVISLVDWAVCGIGFRTKASYSPARLHSA